MNKLYNGRPQWSNWGGLNDVLRNQELSNGSIPLKYNFGGILGSNNINIRASEYGQGGRITYSSSNRSYANRLMATYNSGMLPKGWAYSLSIGTLSFCGPWELGGPTVHLNVDGMLRLVVHC